jgi:hypothetical protein
MSRLKLVLIWLLCVAFVVPLMLGMFVEAIFGNESRALNIAVGYDCAYNGLFGGEEQQTISTRTGNGLIEGLRWAKFVAPIIDFLFGAGHCLANATIKPN